MNIKKGDKVIVIKGRDKGKTGTVTAVSPADNRLKVEGINIMKRHARNRGAGTPAGIIEVLGSIPAANVMLIDPATNKPTRVSYQMVGDKKVRVATKSKTPIEDVKK